MSLRTLLTQERSPERWIVGTVGVGALVYSFIQVNRSQYGVAAFLAVAGVVALAAAVLCTDRALRFMGVVAVVINIAAAAAALVGGL
jgi:hypothetical protein